MPSQGIPIDPALLPVHRQQAEPSPRPVRIAFFCPIIAVCDQLPRFPHGEVAVLIPLPREGDFLHFRAVGSHSAKISRASEGRRPLVVGSMIDDRRTVALPHLMAGPIVPRTGGGDTGSGFLSQLKMP